MGKLVWLAIGAAAGIVAYRKGQELAEAARQDGVIPTAQRTGSGVMSTAASAIAVANRLANGGQR